MKLHIQFMKLEGTEASGFSRRSASTNGQLFLSIPIWASLISIIDARPVNDNFADRTLIPSIPSTVSGDTTSSTPEVGDPLSDRSIWWKFTPQESGSYFISAYPNYTNFFRLHLYTGSSLNTLVKQNGQRIAGAPVYTWLEKFELTAGVEYSILVGSNIDWDYGPVTLTVTRNTPPAISITNPTANDPYYVGDELELRVNASDPDGSIARVDYYFDLHYYEGSSQPIATSTVAPFSATITLPQAGAYYQNIFAVATDNNGAKTVSASVSFLITYSTQNDFFADRKQITGERIFESGNNRYATLEAGETGGQKSIWWSWTAPASKTFIVSSRGWPSGFYPRIDIYTGSSLNTLTSVGSNSFNGLNTTYTAQVALSATADQTYAIRVTTVGGIGGETSLSILPPSPPGTPPQIESFRISKSGEMEFMILSNSAAFSELQGSPDLKSWTPFGSTYPPNGYFREVFPRPSDPSYFYKISEKIPGP